MKKIISSLFILATGLAAASVAVADDHERIIDVWTCTVKEGKTIDDVKAANAKWSKYMKANLKGGDVDSYIMTPIVGARGNFMYADAYSSLAAWTEGEALESDELDAINEELGAVADCSQNSLYRSEAS